MQGKSVVVPVGGVAETPWKAYAALEFGVLCIGLSAIFVKIAGVPGTVSAFYRVFFASLVLVPLWLVRRPAEEPV